MAMILDAGLAAAAGPTYLDVTASPYNAKGDAVIGLTNCKAFTNGTITCPTATPGFSLPAFPQTAVLDDAGSSNGGTTGTRIPLVTSVVGTGSVNSNVLTFTVSPSPIFAANGTSHVDAFDQPSTMDTGSSGGSGYKFNSAQTLLCSATGTVTNCSGSDTPATGAPGIMTAASAAVATGGSLATGSTGCTLTSGTQIGLAGNISNFTGTIAGGVLTGVSVSNGGSITADSASYGGTSYTETLTGCGFPTGVGTQPTITIKYSIVLEQVKYSAGLVTDVYATTAPCVGNHSPFLSSDNGTGLALGCSGAGTTFAGTVSWGTDNTGAFQAALGKRGTATPNSMNYRSATAQPTCIYVPAGNYLLSPLNSPISASGSYIAQGYGCWLGDEHYQSNIFVIPNTGGDVFAWTDANSNSSLPDLGAIQTFSNLAATPPTNNQAGSSFRNLTILGDRLSKFPQNGLTFYGKTQQMLIDNAVIDYLRGHAIYAGVADDGPNAWGDFNESIIQNSRFEHDGNASAAVEITAQNTEGSNNINMVNDRFYQNIGTSLWIHNGTGMVDSHMVPLNGARGIRIVNLKIEGSRVSNSNKGGDLLELGDPATGYPTAGVGVSDVLMRNVELVNPILGFAALHVLGDDPNDTGNIDFEGAIFGVSDYGAGLQVETAKQSTFKAATNATTDYNLVVGTISAAGCTGSLIGNPGFIYDENGGEAGLTSCIDPAAKPRINTPTRQRLFP